MVCVCVCVSVVAQRHWHRNECGERQKSKSHQNGDRLLGPDECGERQKSKSHQNGDRLLGPDICAQAKRNVGLGLLSHFKNTQKVFNSTLK